MNLFASRNLRCHTTNPLLTFCSCTSAHRAAAERIGVFAEPEVVTKQLSAQHPFIIIASDGVFEFLSSQSVVDMVGGQPYVYPLGKYLMSL